jgi:hypothetical protein
MTYIVEGMTIANEADRQIRRLGEYATLKEAVAAAKQLVDEFLMREFRPGILPSALFARYQDFGEVPFIFSDDVDVTMNVPDFNHFQFAMNRCTEICAQMRNEDR